MFSSLFSNPIQFIFMAIGLVIAITIHEFSHAFVADKLGDPTARSQNRLTLNPLAHLDPLGTVALLFMGFGWGRPVPFDPYNLRNPRRDSALISLAGPTSNILLAITLSLILHFLPLPLLVTTLFSFLIALNVMLAIFNLVPVYPLDGEKILSGLLPASTAIEYSRVMRQWGTIILIFMILPMGGTSPITALISPVISFVTHLLL